MLLRHNLLLVGELELLLEQQNVYCILCFSMYQCSWN